MRPRDGFDSLHLAGNLGIPREQPLGGYARVIGRPFGIVVPGEGRQAGPNSCRQLLAKPRNPIGGSAHVRSAEARCGNTSRDGLGKARPLFQIVGKVPSGRTRTVDGVVIEVRFIADLEILQMPAHGARHIGCLLCGFLRRAVAEVEAVDQPPARCVEESGQCIDGFRLDCKQAVRHPVLFQLAQRNPQLRRHGGSIGLEPAKLAGVAADAENSMRAQ